MKCNQCEFLDKEKNICLDTDVFIDKNDGSVTCRYLTDSIPYFEYKKEKIDGVRKVQYKEQLLQGLE